MQGKCHESADGAEGMAVRVDCHCWEQSGQNPGQGADGGHWEAAGTPACLMER